MSDETIIIDGHEYEPWMVNPSTSRKHAYERRFVRFVTRGDTLFVHTFDVDDARRADEEAEPLST